MYHVSRHTTVHIHVCTPYGVSAQLPLSSLCSCLPLGALAETTGGTCIKEARSGTRLVPHPHGVPRGWYVAFCLFLSFFFFYFFGTHYQGTGLGLGRFQNLRTQTHVQGRFPVSISSYPNLRPIFRTVLYSKFLVPQHNP